MVTTVSEGNVLPFSVAVTVTEVALSSSPRVDGLVLRVMPVGAASSSVIVVVIDFEVPEAGCGASAARRTRYGDGKRLARALVYDASSVVCTVNV